MKKQGTWVIDPKTKEERQVRRPTKVANAPVQKPVTETKKEKSKGDK